MKARFWHVDAFADAPFTGNPAAVLVLDAWPEDVVLQAIAAENNLSETAFVVKEEAGWHIRWFTPLVEVDLCGHATLASAWVVLNHLEPGERVEFQSRSGVLAVFRDGGLLVLDFPTNKPRASIFPPDIERMLGKPVREVLATQDHLVCVVDSAAAVASVNPDMAAIATLSKWAVIVTAPGEGEVDFVSRFFAPKKGVPEDPVTGSAHCVLVPFWAKRLGKSRLVARQLSKRGGTLYVEDAGERVLIGGNVAPFVEGVMEV